VADISEDELEVHKPKKEAAGVKAVMMALERAVAQAGSRTAHSMLRFNQRCGFDCPGCAWAESDKKRKVAEFCENGADKENVARESNTPGFKAMFVPFVPTATRLRRATIP
jgi:formate dehydrogenase major subunit